MIASTLATIQRVLVEQFGLANDQVVSTARLTELGVDSLATIELIFELEKCFGMELAEEPPPIDTVGDIAAYVEQVRLARARPAAAS